MDDPALNTPVTVEIVVEPTELIRSSLGIEPVPEGKQPAAGRLVDVIRP